MIIKKINSGHGYKTCLGIANFDTHDKTLDLAIDGYAVRYTLIFNNTYIT